MTSYKISKNSYNQVNVDKFMFQQTEKSNVQILYEKFKQMLLPLIVGHVRDNYDTLTNDETILVVALGKNNLVDDSKKIPTLDLNRGNKDGTWSLEQTLNQYIKGIKGGNSILRNISGYVINETLRYLHTNPDTQSDAPNEINEMTSFKPVMPNKICKDKAFIIMSNIFPADNQFLAKINSEIAKINANYEIVIKEIKGIEKSIIINDNTLTLSNNFICLSLKIKDLNYSKRDKLPSQDDEKIAEPNQTKENIDIPKPEEVPESEASVESETPKKKVIKRKIPIRIKVDKTDKTDKTT